jgi:hypothetical protein
MRCFRLRHRNGPVLKRNMPPIRIDALKQDRCRRGCWTSTFGSTTRGGHACLAALARARCARCSRRTSQNHTGCGDPEFDPKMAEVLCVHSEVESLKQSAVAGEGEPPAVATVSYDEKLGVQAIGTTAPDLPPVPSQHGYVVRDHEYVRHGTLSLLAGIDFLTGEPHASVEERSRELVAFRQMLGAAYPPATAIKLILENHSAHISKETRGLARARGLVEQPRRPTRRRHRVAQPGLV